jgi:hypothetical protein
MERTAHSGAGLVFVDYGTLRAPRAGKAASEPPQSIKAKPL